MNLKEAALEQFENCERDELVTFCDILGVEYLPQNNAGHLRKKLLEALGEYREVFGASDARQSTTTLPDLPQAQQLDIATLSGLNLRSQGQWQGKRRRIELHRVLEYENTAFPHFFAWEGLHCYVPFGEVVDIPYSIYRILLDSNKGKKLHRRRKIDEEGRIFYLNEWRDQQRFMVTDYGVTPGTEHLPEDVQDQVRMMWNATNGFDGYSKTQLKRLCALLKISVPDEWKPSDMLNAMKRLLGLIKGSDLSAPEGRTPKASAATAG